MKKLNLLFTKDSLQYQIWNNKKILKEASFFLEENADSEEITERLKSILTEEKYDEISVISAINHFGLMPQGFNQHELGYKIIGYNSPVDEETEELMLSINKKFGVQFYYSFPKNWYQLIKENGGKYQFNFSGEKFLNSLPKKIGREIHINLYHQQCEFFAIENENIKLYNNLDVNSEVDFLYFIMFTLSKIGFDINETNFLVYGEITQNETFISELRKFVKNIKIVHNNLPEKNFILN